MERRRLHDIEAAARVHVDADSHTVTTANGTTHPVPEYAQALVRGWAGRYLLPKEWACDVAATYLTLRLEAGGFIVREPMERAVRWWPGDWRRFLRVAGRR